MIVPKSGVGVRTEGVSNGRFHRTSSTEDTGYVW